MNKLILYGYPLFLLFSLVQSCATREQLMSLGVNSLCSGLLLALGILLFPVWILAFAVHISESAADDDLFDDYSVEIHVGRRRKKDGSN